MTGMSQLWLPILLSAVAVFIVSSVIHMMTPWHKSDYPKLPNEDKVRDALRPLGIPPGDYFVPCPSDMKEMGTEAFKEKLNQGPNFIMTMFPTGQRGMGGSLVLWFLYSLVVSGSAAFIASRTWGPEAPQRGLIHFVGLTSWLAYSAALWQLSIWYRRSWLTTIKATIDGAIYAAVTAGIFIWLWPK